jgi:hypothetical protein
MRKRLAERKLITVKDGKNVIQKTIRGVKHRVMQMPISSLYEISPSQPAPQPVVMPGSQNVPSPFPIPLIEPECFHASTPPAGHQEDIPAFQAYTPGPAVHSHLFENFDMSKFSVFVPDDPAEDDSKK